MKNKIFNYKFLLIFFMFFSSENFAKNSSNLENIILAGGCFWGVEDLFQKFDGVVETEVGYSGGLSENPTYQTVSTGLTGHAESVKITFDNSKTSLEKILKFFFAIHDPTQLNQQQNDVGTQYRSAIFYFNDKQKQKAETVIKQAEELKIYKSKIQTKISPATKFYKAENYHQNYLKNNPDGYTCHYVRTEWKF
jgi:methionine-S-sulfoxide reductase